MFVFIIECKAHRWIFFCYRNISNSDAIRLSMRKSINRLIFARRLLSWCSRRTRRLKLIVNYQSGDIGSRPKLTNTFIALASAGVVDYLMWCIRLPTNQFRTKYSCEQTCSCAFLVKNPESSNYDWYQVRGKGRLVGAAPAGVVGEDDEAAALRSGMEPKCRRLRQSARWVESPKTSCAIDANCRNRT